MSVAEEGLIRPVWQEEIEDEIHRNGIKLSVKRGADPGSAAKAADQVKTNMRRAFPGACLDRSDWEQHLKSCTNDPKDRHVLAAAIGAGASHVVTSNIRDFPVPSRPEGFEVVRPDAFLLELLIADPAGVIAAIVAMTSRHRHPPHTPLEIAEKLAASPNARRFGGALVRHLHGGRA